MHRSLTWLVALALAASGCSLALVRGPSSRAMQCNDSYVAPMLDAVVAVGTIAGIVKVTGDVKECRDAGGELCLMELWNVPLGIVALSAVTSAFYGYVVAANCRDYKRSHEDDMRHVDALFAKLGPAAARGDCKEVRALWKEVDELDRELQTNHTSHDPAVVGCLRGADANDLRISGTATPRAAAETSEQSDAGATNAVGEDTPTKDDARKQVSRTMILDAKRAARAGDCATVKRLDARVRAVDPAQHRTVYLADDAIAKCLASAP